VECEGENGDDPAAVEARTSRRSPEEAQVPAHELERWRRIFLEGGANGLKRRDTPAAERELKRVQAKVGELTMKLEIVEWFLKERLRAGVEEVEAFRGTLRAYPTSARHTAMAAAK
jgi:hypothetical protein